MTTCMVVGVLVGDDEGGTVLVGWALIVLVKAVTMSVGEVCLGRSQG